MEISNQYNPFCINCDIEFKKIDDFCEKCYSIILQEIDIVDQSFNIINYDSLKSQYVKKKYFQKYSHYFVKLLFNNTNLKIININSQNMRISFINNLLYKQNTNLSIIFLTLNNFDPNHISFMIYNIDIKYLHREKYDIYKFNHLIGGILIDPWICSNDYIKKIYGNNGFIPNTVLGICELWINNRLLCQKMLENISINICNSCSYNIYLQDLDILNSPTIPNNHIRCLNKYEVDELCSLINNKIEINNISMEE
jgi:hypothetical protein